MSLGNAIPAATEIAGGQKESFSQLPRPLRIALWTQACLWSVDVVYSLAARWLTPRNPFVWPVQRGWHFSDFFSYRPLLPYLHSTRFFTDPQTPFLHPATLIPLYVLFSFRHALTVYCAICLAAWGTAGYLFRRGALARGAGRRNATLLLLAAACSYPLAFSLERGNFETLLACGTLAGSWAFLTRRYNSAAVLWGIFGCTKLYPLLLLAMFLPQRRWRQFALGVGTCAACMVLALGYAGPTIPLAWRLSHSAVSRFVQLYPYSLGVQGYEHSFYGLVKTMLLPLRLNPDQVWTVLAPAMAVGMLLLFFGRVAKMPVVNQLLFLSIGMIALPPCSFDYTLLHLYAPWAALVYAALEAGRRGLRVPGMTAALVLLAVILAPENYLHLRWELFQGTLKASLLVTLLAVCVTCPLAAVARAGVAAAIELPRRDTSEMDEEEYTVGCAV